MMELELKRIREEYGAENPWPTKYTSETLEPISIKEVVARRQEENKRKGNREPKEASHTWDARRKAGHAGY
jgi:hypothetical protein